MQPAMIDTFQKGNVLIFRGGLFLSISDYLWLSLSDVRLMSVWCPSAVAAPLAISANTSPGFSLCPPPLGPYLCGRTVPDAGPASGQALSLHPHSHANYRVHLRWTQPLNRLQSCVTRVTWESDNSQISDMETQSCPISYRQPSMKYPRPLFLTTSFSHLSVRLMMWNQNDKMNHPTCWWGLGTPHDAPQRRAAAEETGEFLAAQTTDGPFRNLLHCCSCGGNCWAIAKVLRLWPMGHGGGADAQSLPVWVSSWRRFDTPSSSSSSSSSSFSCG